MRRKPLREQVIVITGASSGIGLATARIAARRGARVVLAARSAAVLAQVAAEIEAGGGLAVPVTADVGELDDVQAIAVKAMAEFGGFDTWVNVAGLTTYGPLREIAQEDHERLIRTNLWGTVNGSLVAVDHLRKRGGALINVGSIASDLAFPFQGLYAASKHAVKGFTDALRVEIEDVDEAPVSITLIQPTAVDTPYPQHAKNYMAEEPKLPTPMIDAREVADAILRAATQGGRDVKVGAMSRIDTAVARLAPGIGDKLSARQAKRQHYDQPPSRPDGTLYRPGHSGRIDGERPATP
jgi:short-subunit dehydrogenase